MRRGPHLQTAKFVLETRPIRQWAETFPWDAMVHAEEGFVSPAHLLVDTFPAEQGSQRVTDATTLYKAQKKPATYRADPPAVPSLRYHTDQPSA